MSKLFILGNGFDLAHKLPTSYEDFHQYLLETYPRARKLQPTFDVSIEHTDDGIDVDDTDAVAFIRNAIDQVEDEHWWNVESSLAHLPFEDYLSDQEDMFDLDDDRELYRNVYRHEDTSDAFYRVMLKFHKFLVDWVRSIDISDTIPIENFKTLIDNEDDYFLTFNYTCVLEDIYDANEDNVCHIHGAQYSCDSKMLFGHGHVRDEYESLHIGATESLEKIHRLLKKDTNSALDSAEFFFDDLSSVQEIYSIGFSFSEVDLIYIRRICEACNTEKCTWYLFDYRYDETEEEYKRKIREAGFKGEFDIFSMKENEEYEDE
ncbi:bacteriophage abortive infection AbiH family protein [Bacillus sp. AFS059628]|uniref:bacteriophage abortive infection AbiH family protein n=1 Tax=Bacillus sp. AFS059628 TaxID=2033508 RepID=UPI00211D9BC9|nr:bacteriophage abortive infection AbiH family protein [Bacillus sp. AFS059628]